MDLHVIWFILIAVLFSGFFFLEGFDYGVGMIMPFLGKTDGERRAIINTIGPVWDGNEVWMITAGGAMFAAFPHWYATLFSGFYLALFLMLLALIIRGVAFEYRSKNEDPAWRERWDWAIFFGSFTPALLWGVAIANLVRGVPIDAHMQYTGTFWTLLNPYGLLGGVAAVAVFVMHGANFLGLKLEGDLAERARAISNLWWWVAVAAVVLFVVGLFGHQQGLSGRPGAAGGGAGAGGGSLTGRLPPLLGRRPGHHPGDGDRLHRPLPQRHALDPQPRLEPDHLQRLGQRLHPGRDDGGGANLHPARPPLPGLDLLGLPRPRARRRGRLLGATE